MNELLSHWAGQAFWVGLAATTVLLLAEGQWPRAATPGAMGRRWLANALVMASTIVVFRWLPPLSLFGAALLAEQNGWGFFNKVPAPQLVAVVFAWLAVDLSGYVVHRLEHRVPLLWRIHRLHHSDPDVDVTTTYRFHPFEVLLRAAVSVAVVFVIGVPLVAAAGCVLLSALTSAFSHTNLRLPQRLERSIGLIVITPDIHRTHHSVDRADYESNYSVCLSCWDRLFGTFRAVPTAGYANLRFGVESRTAEEGTSILRMLADPFLPERTRAPEMDPDGVVGSSAGDIIVSANFTEVLGVPHSDVEARRPSD